MLEAIRLRNVYTCFVGEAVRSRARLVTASLGLAVFFWALADAEARAEGMSIPGTFTVDDKGAASYSIPITVPPGTAGMVPALSLDYSSQEGNGLAGVGWSLSGLPSIGRCPKTMAQDSVRGSVNYDANDRFCMEGQRLILITGVYGADGSEYRTEIEGFSKIVASGTAGNGPASFTVRTKTGQVMEFGNTTDSRILAQGKTTARSWGVNKISDTKGNYLTITYTNDTTNGQAYPTRIDYTGNAAAGLVPYNSVQFVYETRPDIVPLYHAGSLQKTTVRLTDVKTYEGANLVSDYKLSYDVSIATSRSLMTSVRLCSDVAGTSCLPATTYAYLATAYANGGYGGYTMNNNPASANGTLSGYQAYSGDVNGDGISDVIWAHTDTSGQADALSSYLRPATNGIRIWLGQRDGGLSLVSDPGLNTPTGNPISSYLQGYKLYPVDLDADGKTDLLSFLDAEKYYGAGTCCSAVILYSIINNSNVFVRGSGVLDWGSTGYGSPPYYVFTGYAPYNGDFNGDGRADVFWDKEDAGGKSVGARVLWFINGDSSYTIASGLPPPDSSYVGFSPYLSDFDADGRSDLFWLNANTNATILWLSNGDGTFRTFSGSAPSGYKPYLADFNGDGNADVFWLSAATNSCVLWLSRGEGGFTNIFTGSSPSGYYPTLTDINVDGRTDILWYNPSSNFRQLWLGKGDGTFAIYTNFGAQDGSNIGNALRIIDLNGDGKPEILWDAIDSYSRSTGTRRLWLSDGVSPDLLSSFTTGLGLTTTITYRPLTDGSVYTKDTGSVYPMVDVQSPLYVVSRVDAANGIGGGYSSAYAYSGAKFDLSGRGFLGFRQRTVTDLQSNVMQTTNWNQSFPYTGVLSSETKALGSQTLNSTVNTYSATNLGETRNFVHLDQSVASSWDTDGTAIPVITTSYQYDAYGNATQVMVATPDGSSKTTTNTYTNDTTNWFLGRLTGTSVTSTVP